MLKVPEVMHVAVGQDDKPDILRMGVFPGLFLADKRVELLRLGFKNGYREAAFIQQEVINVAVCRLLEVVAEVFKGLLLELDVCFERHVSGAGLIIKEAPASPSEKVVDQNPCFGFLRHSRLSLFNTTLRLTSQTVCCFSTCLSIN